MCHKLRLARARNKLILAIENANGGRATKNVLVPGRTGYMTGSSKKA